MNTDHELGVEYEILIHDGFVVSTAFRTIFPASGKGAIALPVLPFDGGVVRVKGLSNKTSASMEVEV